MNTWQASYRLIRNTPRLYALTAFLWTIVHLFPLVPGWITRAVLDRLSGEATVGWNIQTLLALFVGISLVRMVEFMGAFLAYARFRETVQGTLRLNMMGAILSKPGAAALPNSPGEAVSRFSGDVEEISSFAADRLIDVWGLVALPIVGLGVLFSINARITAVILIPLLIVMILVNLMRKQMQRYRDQRRRAASRVIGFIAEMFGSVQAIKVANAESYVGARLAELNEERRKTALKDTLWSELSTTSFMCTVEIGVGIVLLMAAQAMSEGSFTVGDYAIFVAYLWEAAEGLTFIGRLLAVQTQADVSLNRLARLVDYDPQRRDDLDVVTRTLQENPQIIVVAPSRPAAYATLTAPTRVSLDGTFAAVPIHNRLPADILIELTARQLTYQHPTSGRGIFDIDLTLAKGSFTVVTGRIGSGKTTLLRALLGLLPLDTGEVRWNGALVSQRDDFFVPPRAAYTGQVPRLFSDSLRNNILMGQPEGSINIESAIYGAVMEKDLGDLQAGLETTVGPRGVKLSGGQIQRTAAARTLARRPELYVFDDLSSALDVETEKLLWERLEQLEDGRETIVNGQKMMDDGRWTMDSDNNHRPPSTVHRPPSATCLVVSHRRAALRRADHILVLKEGRVEDEGTLDELLGRCEEMQRLWQGDVQN